MQQVAAPQVVTVTARPGLRRQAQLAWSMAVGDLRRQYVGSFLDVVWAVAKPLLELLTYTFVFTVLLRVQFAPDYPVAVSALFLFCGWQTYITVAETITRSTNVVRENVHLIRKVHVPPEILPAYINISEMFIQCVRVVILILATVAVGWHIGPWALLLPFVMAMQLLFTYGLSLLLATLAIFYRDVHQLLQPSLLIWMFLTPVFYPENVFPRQFLPILVFNPLSHVIGMYRQILLNGQPPLPGQVIIFSACAVTTFALGLWVFRRHAPHFSDMLGG